MQNQYVQNSDTSAKTCLCETLFCQMFLSVKVTSVDLLMMMCRDRSAQVLPSSSLKGLHEGP